MPVNMKQPEWDSDDRDESSFDPMGRSPILTYSILMSPILKAYLLTTSSPRKTIATAGQFF